MKKEELWIRPGPSGEKFILCWESLLYSAKLTIKISSYITSIMMVGRKRSLWALIDLWIQFAHFPSMQNGQHLSQLSFRHLTKFGGKVRKIFWTQPFGLGQISYCFNPVMNKIFWFEQISQLLSWGYLVSSNKSTSLLFLKMKFESESLREKNFVMQGPSLWNILRP